MTPTAESSILEILKQLRSDMNQLKSSVGDINLQLSSMRRHMHASDSDNLTQDDRLSKLETRLGRIETRLDLVDEPSA